MVQAEPVTSICASAAAATLAAVKARGALFLVLAVGLLGIGLAAARAEVWPIALAGAALGLWMGDLARRDLWR